MGDVALAGRHVLCGVPTLSGPQQAALSTPAARNPGKSEWRVPPGLWSHGQRRTQEEPLLSWACSHPGQLPAAWLSRSGSKVMKMLIKRVQGRRRKEGGSGREEEQQACGLPKWSSTPRNSCGGSRALGGHLSAAPGALPSRLPSRTGTEAVRSGGRCWGAPGLHSKALRPGFLAESAQTRRPFPCQERAGPGCEQPWRGAVLGRPAHRQTPSRSPSSACAAAGSHLGSAASCS